MSVFMNNDQKSEYDGGVQGARAPSQIRKYKTKLTDESGNA